MIDFNLSPEQELIKETARDFANTQLLPGVIERDENQIFPKDEIKKMVIQGMTDEEIKEHFVEKFGIEILANPPKEGFDSLVWLAPLVFGFFGIVFLYRYIFS